MIIKTLELQNFRNYKTLKLDFDRGTNILYGDNAQGKTNILEAIYISGTTKSHKGCKERDIIRFGSDESHIRIMIEKQSQQFRLDMHLKKNKAKGIAVNTIPIKKASDLFGILNLVFFSPEDLNIVKNGPSERRRFMDSELCQLDKIYLSHLAKYNKILNQRNKLLKDINFRPDLKDTLSIWDIQLIQYGKQIIKSRAGFIYRLNEIVGRIHYQISGGKEQMLLSYDPNIQENLFEDELKKAREKDLKAGQTSIGPHKDDMSFSVSGVDIRKFGSQGQQRTCALSLKLSEIELVKQVMKDAPVLLLDDVLSELDSNRQNYLLKNICGTQTIITCTGLDELVRSRFHMNRMFEVIEGKVIRG